MSDDHHLVHHPLNLAPLALRRCPGFGPDASMSLPESSRRSENGQKEGLGALWGLYLPLHGYTTSAQVLLVSSFCLFFAR
jgi:hypothetical protein